MQSDPKAKMRAANIEIKDKRTARISTAQYPDVGIRMQENYEYCNPTPPQIQYSRKYRTVCGMVKHIYRSTDSS